MQETAGEEEGKLRRERGGRGRQLDEKTEERERKGERSREIRN